MTPNIEELLQKNREILESIEAPEVDTMLKAVYCMGVGDAVRMVQREIDQGGPNGGQLALNVLLLESAIYVQRLKSEASFLVRQAAARKAQEGKGG